MSNNFNEIKDRFNKDAKLFNDIYGKEAGFNSWFNRTFRKPIFERFEVAMSQIGNPEGKRILDIGCGPGAYVMSLAARGAGFVLGLDLSPAMLEFAERRIKAHRLEKICELQSVNFLEASFDKKFDFSLAIGVFDYLADPLTFLKKMKAVTSGKMIISFPGHSLIREPLRKLRYIFTKKGSVYFYSKQDIETLVGQAGITQYEIIPLKTGSGFVLVA